MKMTTYPEYKDIFIGEPVEDFSVFLRDWSSEYVIKTLAAINGMLVYSPTSKTQQDTILEYLLRRQPENYKKQILGRIYRYYENIGLNTIAIFSTYFNLELMHYELINYRDFDMHPTDCTPAQELNFLKAYILFKETITKPTRETYKPYIGTSLSRQDFFRKSISVICSA